MKKFIVFIALLCAGTALFLYFYSGMKQDVPAEKARAGKTAADMTLGMKDSAVYGIKNFFGRSVVILAFTDNSSASRTFMEQAEKNKKYFTRKKDLVWFNIKKDGTHALIEEFAGNTGLRYRALYSSLPEFYSFTELPSVVIIDKYGIIKNSYTGYSPTIITDIKNALGG